MIKPWNSDIKVENYKQNFRKWKRIRDKVEKFQAFLEEQSQKRFAEHLDVTQPVISMLWERFKILEEKVGTHGKDSKSKVKREEAMGKILARQTKENIFSALECNWWWKMDIFWKSRTQNMMGSFHSIFKIFP